MLRTFQSVSTRPNQQSNEIDVRMFFLRNHYLVMHTDNRWPVKVKYNEIIATKANLNSKLKY